MVAIQPVDVVLDREQVRQDFRILGHELGPKYDVAAIRDLSQEFSRMSPDHELAIFSVRQDAPWVYYDGPRVGQRQERSGGSRQQRQTSRNVLMVQVEGQELEDVVRALIKRSSQFLYALGDFMDELFAIFAVFFAAASLNHSNNFVVVLQPAQQVLNASDFSLIRGNLKPDNRADDAADVLGETEGGFVSQE